MKVEILNHWTLKTGMGDSSSCWKSAWMTSGLCAVIVASLVAVIHVKYENHRLYSEIKKLETQSHSVYRDHQVVSSQYVKNIGYDSVQTFTTQKNMISYY